MNSHFYGVAHLLNWSPLRRRAVSECPPRGAHGISTIYTVLAGLELPWKNECMEPVLLEDL